jgi:molybdopterin-guanine dinucleotide biosynthesis protein A
MLLAIWTAASRGGEPTQRPEEDGREVKPDQEQFNAEGFVLAGGRSTRMGQDKALLSLAGRSLLDLALDKLRTLPLAGAPRGIPRIAAARSDLSAHAAVIGDLHPGCGPLSGIEAALAASAQPLNVFLPVDVPLLPPRFLLWMLERAAITGALVTVPRFNGWPQPLCAVYHRDLLGPIAASLVAGEHKVMPVVTAAARAHSSAHRVDIFDVELVASAHGQMPAFSPLPLYRWFHNCNTPEDMAGIGNALVLTQ